jgi:hypothetical protein
MRTENLIKRTARYVKGLKVTAEVDKEQYINFVFDNNESRSTIRIKEGSTWKAMQKQLDAMLAHLAELVAGLECELCCERSGDFGTCDKCLHSWCFRCHFKLIRANRGMFICPYCRRVEGKRVPPYMLDQYMKEYIEEFCES